MNVPTLPLARPSAFGPAPGYAALRQQGPVVRVLAADGARAWAVVDAATARRVLSDERFLITPPGSPPSGSLHSDGPQHARLRRLLSRAFTPRALAELRPRVERHAADLVAALERRGRGADFVTTVARPMPLAVTVDVLGIDVADHAGSTAGPMPSPGSPAVPRVPTSSADGWSSASSSAGSSPPSAPIRATTC
jgi:cytochrome P450